MAILITGGTGFVGINLVRYYARAGMPVVSLDQLPPDPSTRGFLGRLDTSITFIEGDVRDAGLLRRIADSHDLEYIIHAAAITPDIERERRNPGEIVDVNLMGTVQLLDLARSLPRLRRTLVISSAAVCGVRPEERPVIEDDPVAPTGLYAICKYTSELVARRYRDLFGLDAVSARLGWVYGPMERETASSRALSTVCVIAQMALAGQPVQLAGPEAVRDWTHAEDVARGSAALIGAPSLQHDLYNLAGGRGYRNAELLADLQSELPQLEYAFVAPEQANVPQNLKNRRGPLDIGRLERETGFAPRYDLRTGFADYLKENPGPRALGLANPHHL